MNKKLITSLLVSILFISSFPFLPVQAANAVGYVKITLLDVNIIDDHDGIGFGAGEIYFNFDVTGSEFATAQTETDSGDNITFNFVLFDSLIEDGSNLYIYIDCWDHDDLDEDDFVGDFNFTMLSLDLASFVALYGNYEVFVHTGTDATFYLEVIAEDNVVLPPEVDETAYVTITLVSAVIHDKHEIIGKGDGEIYFSYQIYDTRRCTSEYRDITDGETIPANLEIYKGPMIDDELYYDILCFEADIDKDDVVGGIVRDYPVFHAEWWRASRTNSFVEVIPISDVTFTIQIDVTYPAVPDKYDIIGLKDDAAIMFETTRDAQVTLRYGTSQGALTETIAVSGYRLSHYIQPTGLAPNTKFYFEIETVTTDGEVYVDDNHGAKFYFETIEDLPIYIQRTENLGIEEFYYQDLTGEVSFVNFTIGMFAGLSVPLLFSMKTPRYVIPGNSISTEATVNPEEGYIGAEIIGEVEVYGYKLQLFDPISYFYNFITPFGDLTLYSFEYSYPLGALNKTETIYSIDVTASVDMLFEVGIYLENNVTMWFNGNVDDGSKESFTIADGGETVIHTDTVSSGATDGQAIVPQVNTTLQFNNLYLRLKSMNLTVVGSIDTIVAVNPSIDINYEVVGPTGLFAPIEFPVLNDLLFPVALKHESLATTSFVDAVDPVISSVTDSHVSGNTYKVQATVTDNRAIWDVTAEVEYADLSTQQFILDHVSGDLYEFTFTIPDGESVDVTILTRDVAGRPEAHLLTVFNPIEVPELVENLWFVSILILPLAIIPIIWKKKRKRI